MVCSFFLPLFWDFAFLFENGIYHSILNQRNYYMVFLPIIAAYLLGTMLDSFSFWGTVRISGTGVIAVAPFRRRITINFEEVNCIGVDYGVVNGSRQFWIFISKIAIEPKYFRKIHKLPINKNVVRIAYSPKVFEAFLLNLPMPLRKQLEKGQSVIKTYDIY